MEPLTSTHLIATGLVFAVSAVFAMLGLGGGMLYVPLVQVAGTMIGEFL